MFPVGTQENIGGDAWGRVGSNINPSLLDWRPAGYMDDMSVVMSAEAYQHQISGGLTRIQSHLRELKGVFGTRDKKLKDSFGDMQSEMNRL